LRRGIHYKEVEVRNGTRSVAWRRRRRKSRPSTVRQRTKDELLRAPRGRSNSNRRRVRSLILFEPTKPLISPHDPTRSATNALRIKKAYRRKALLLHPDRNYGNTEASTALFAQVLAAYEVLSDPQERAWYDSHEDAILSGFDPANADPAADDEYERNVGLTSADEIVRMMGRFGRGNVAFTDAPSGFFGYLREVFERLSREEDVAARREGVDGVEYPGFGHKDDGHEDVVKGFYGVWMGFSTRKTFAWRDKYRTSEAPDRRTRRYIEKENQLARNEGIREFNDAVRSMVAFVRKRDPRFKANTQSEEEREKTLREATAARAAKQRAENERKIAGEVLPEWAKHREPDEVIEESGDESEEEQWECVACRKTFKSEKQWEAHEKSNKHKKAVQALRKKMMKDGISLDLDDDATEEEDDDAIDDRSYPVLEDPEMVVGHATSATKTRHDEDEYLEGVVGNLHIDGHTQAEPDDGETNDDAIPADPIRDTNSEPAADSATTSSDEENDNEDESDEAKFNHKATLPPTSPIPAASQTTANSAPEPKLGKAAQKRARKAAQAAATEENGSSHKCASCNAEFPSKTRLFQHLKDFGHASPVPGGGGGKNAKGKKR